MRIVLIDDHEIFRLGLRSLLEAESHIEVVGEAGGVKTGLAVVEQEQPDIVVVDYAMPGNSGLDAIAKIQRKHPQCRIILLTASRSEWVLAEALSSGVHGVVLKQDTSSQLIQAVETVHKGEQIVSTSIIPLVKRANSLAELTKRERQILRMIAAGFRNREIGEELNISIKTVDSHRTNLMRKLNLHSLVDVVDFANKTGILDSSI